MSTQNSKTRTITMTGRPPVRIVDADWPLIASAKGDSYASNDYGRYQQALAQGECDTYAIRVRQHEDGRTIVSGVFDAATAWTGGKDRRGGELLEPDDSGIVPAASVVGAIQRVGSDCGIPEATIRDCIADLPPEEI